MAWLANYVACAVQHTGIFPAVFNVSSAGSIFNAALIQGIFNRLVQTYAALDLLTPYQRGLTAFANILQFNRETVPVTPPRAEPSMTLSTSRSDHSGLIGIVEKQVDLLRRQPTFTEVIARQFGILPTTAPFVDPSTFNPDAQGRFTGGAVIISFRAPSGLRGVDMAEVRVDRNDGTGIHLLGTTTHARFTDHSALPADGARAVFTYYICYLDRDQMYIGQQSIVDVTVQGRAGHGRGQAADE